MSSTLARNTKHILACDDTKLSNILEETLGCGETISAFLKPKIWQDFIQRLLHILWIGPRNHLEETPRFRQIIPYVVIYNNGYIVMYKRNKKAGETRLHYKTSIGFGGHIDLKDVEISKEIYDTQNNDGTYKFICIKETIMKGLKRELKEELNFDKFTKDNGIKLHPLGVLRLSDTQVNSVHLGLVYVADVSEANLDDLPGHCIEDGLEKFEWIELDSLIGDGKTTSLNLEWWSVATLTLLKEARNAWTHTLHSD